jgi:HSP20 family protein
VFTKKETGLRKPAAARDPFALLRYTLPELDRLFDEAAWPFFKAPAFGAKTIADTTSWIPGIDVYEKDNRLVTKIDLPGMKKEDVKVEVADGQLVISGDRKRENEEKTNDFYRCERAYGSFYRMVPLPEGVKLEDVKAVFAEGVLEISVPLPVRPAAKVMNVDIQEPAKVEKTAA